MGTSCIPVDLRLNDGLYRSIWALGRVLGPFCWKCARVFRGNISFGGWETILRPESACRNAMYLPGFSSQRRYWWLAINLHVLVQYMFLKI